MKKILFIIGLLWSAVANAQFTPGQLLTAAELNSQFALYSKLAGATFTGPVSIPNLTVTSTASLPSGSVTLSNLASQAANTILANATASSASPTAVAVPSCSTTASALNWTTSSGFSCNTTVNAATLGGATFASPGAIGSGTASTGAFTTLSASGTVSGIGFTNLLSPYALLASPTFTGTPAAPTASATSNTTQIATTAMVNSAVTGGSLAGSFTTVAASNTITPSQTAGIVGTTTNNNANAGSFGEYGSITSAATSLTSGSYVDVQTQSLTAGDWDVECTILYTLATSTTLTAMVGGINTVANTNPNGTVGTGFTWSTASGTLATGAATVILSTPLVRESLSTTTTVRCGAQANFATSTLTATAQLRWRRVR